MKKYLFIILGLALAFVSCKKDSEETKPIDTWVGTYSGTIGMKGTVVSEPLTMVSDTIFDKTIEDMTMTATKLLSADKGIFTFKYGVVPIPFNGTVTETTANLADLEYVPTAEIPITVGGTTFTISGIKFSEIALNYDNGVVTGTGNALITGQTTILSTPTYVYLSLDMTPNFTKIQ